MVNDEKEILSAEVFIDSFQVNVDTTAIDEELDRINRELQDYDIKASLEDYAIAVLCGILSGGIDFVMQPRGVISMDELKISATRLIDCLNKAQGDKAPPVSTKRIPHGKVKEGILGKLPGLEKLSVKGSPVGLVAAILRHLNHSGLVNIQGDDIKLIPEGITQNDGYWLLGTGIAVSVIKWLAGTSMSEEEYTNTHLSTLKKLRELARSTPAVDEIITGLDRWQGQLAGEMKGYKQKRKTGMGMDGIFVSMMHALSVLPTMKQTKLPGLLKKMETAKAYGIEDIPLAQMVSRQSMPVIINELLVRSAYFITHLMHELSVHENVENINWENIVPYGNRAIDRMITISSLTFSVADTADALVQTTIEIESGYILDIGNFKKRFNVIGAGRAAIAIQKDVSMERREAALIHERRLLTETKSQMVIEKLHAYQQALEERVSEYIAKDISVFLTGFDAMDRGARSGNSDLFIRGNVTIQRALGREPQFETQREFDELMDSDLPLQL